jgi:hypothetical protein
MNILIVALCFDRISLLSIEINVVLHSYVVQLNQFCPLSILLRISTTVHRQNKHKLEEVR